jgi:hypothetical protein
MTPWAVAPAALALPACDDGESGPSKSGELSTGRFLYRCLGDSDPYCDAGTPSSFPEAMAVGGRFDLEYDPEEDVFEDVPIPRVIPASPASVQTPGMGYAIGRAGFAAFLARDAFGDVYDLRHIYAAPVGRIAVTSAASQELATIRVEVGETIDLFAQPQDEFRALLGGSLDYAWTSDDDTVAGFASVDLDRDITLEGRAQGTTTIRIEAGGFQQMVTVEVGPIGAGTDDGDDTDGGGPPADDDDDDGTDGGGPPADDGESTGGGTGEGESSGGGSTGGESTGEAESTGGESTGEAESTGGESSSTGGD